MPAQIILLNGASSSGKTTLSKALQGLANRPLIHLSSDYLALGLPRRKEDSGRFQWWDGYRVAFFDGFHRSIASYAEAANDLIVDHVIESRAWRDDLARLLEPFAVLLVGVHCDLDELERRERSRGDRRAGEGRSHQLVDRIHSFGPYDLEVDTTDGNYEELAETILEAQERGPGTALGEKPTV